MRGTFCCFSNESGDSIFKKKMFYKGKIKDQLIVEDVRGNHRIGLYIGEEHYCTGRSLSLHELLSNNIFYIYKNTKENLEMIVSNITKEDNDLFTWWTLVDKNGNKITSYENKKNEFSSYIGRKETDKEIYEKYKDCEVLSIYDIDIDINFENNYITVKLNI